MGQTIKAKTIAANIKTRLVGLSRLKVTGSIPRGCGLFVRTQFAGLFD
jgi:hypothetical protein